MLLSGIRSTAWGRGSSSSPDSSSVEGVVGRRGGGSLSPRAIVRVGGGGSLLAPNSFRSPSPLDGRTNWERVGRGGGIDPSGDALVPRRTGSGGGDCFVFGTEEIRGDAGVWWWRGGGGGGGTVAARGERDIGLEL